MRFEPARQHQARTQRLRGLVDRESWGIGGNLEEYPAGLTEIDRMKILAVNDWCDVIVTERSAPLCLLFIGGRAPCHVMHCSHSHQTRSSSRCTKNINDCAGLGGRSGRRPVAEPVTLALDQSKTHGFGEQLGGSLITLYRKRNVVK